jgi:hypothetical protein
VGNDGEDFIVADDPQRAAAEIVSCIKHPDGLDRISDNGRRTARAAYCADELRRSAGPVVSEFAEFVSTRDRA